MCVCVCSQRVATFPSLLPTSACLGTSRGCTSLVSMRLCVVVAALITRAGAWVIQPAAPARVRAVAGLCIDQITADFLRDPAPKKIDTSCVEAMTLRTFALPGTN